jgi:hypothetical protein
MLYEKCYETVLVEIENGKNVILLTNIKVM